ncbi:MAG TPA: TolC family protein [bacterium]|jgi:outer membrane protein TolC|nr:TolC family protein [bacterium]
MRNYFLLAVILFGSLMESRALADELTLKAAQNEAVQQSPYYQKAQAMESQTSWGQYEKIADGFLPQVSISGQHFFAENYSYLNVEFGAPTPLQFPEIYPQTTLNLDARIDVFDGFKNIHQVDSADRYHQAAQILLDWSSFQIQEQVRMKYYQALAAKILLDMANENVKTLEDHLRIVEERLQNGEATKYDLLRVKVQLSTARSNQIAANDNLVLSRESLAQTMGMKNDDRPLSGKLPVVTNVDKIAVQLTEVDFSQRPDVKAKEMQAKAAEDESAAEGSFWAPKISLIGEYQFYNSPDFLTSGITNSNDFRTDYFLGAAATWDIFDGGISLAKAKEAEEKANGANADLRAIQIQAPYDFDTWKRKLVSSAAVYQAKLTDVDEAKESVRLATLGFKAGVNTTTDVLDAELDKFTASAGLVQAQVGMLEAVINLELAIGKRLNND